MKTTNSLLRRTAALALAAVLALGSQAFAYNGAALDAVLAGADAPDADLSGATCPVPI